ncbi:GNAT family N-acetyltransferase [Sporosalibacterium faouarense]|uniref:GNAT family N-acetyltransferase n=1 Tax=Sporosalibacterium faouarense TaxID=516123 RepID=UPI00192C0A07|nr:GNAT family protein [Sporosalibacterium faouarense]
MIKGNLINLRLVEESDLEKMNKLQNDVSEKGLYSDLTLRSKAQLEKQFQEFGLVKKEYSILLITDKQDNIIGMIQHFKGSIYSTGYEIGLLIYKKENRKNGYATEALKLYTSYMFESHPIERLELSTSVDNIGAQKVATKCGYVLEGINRKSCYIRGVATDLKKYSILRDEAISLSELLSSM